MSGKYAKKKKKSGKKALKWVLIALAAVLCLAAALLLLPEKNPSQAQSQPMETAAGSVNEAAGEMATQPTAVEGKTSFQLTDDLEITNLGSYTGLYMEDGSDDVVSGIAMVIVQNNGDKALQYAEITLSGPAGDALFKLSTLKPGEKAVVLEANRKAYTPSDIYTDAEAQNVAFFQQQVSTQEDKLKIQPLDGGFNIINISQEAITGKITVYFKDSADGMYYGGITYRGSIEGGMQPGEIRQVMSENFSASGTTVVFVTITES